MPHQPVPPRALPRAAGVTPGRRQRRLSAIVVVVLTALSSLVIVGGGERLLLGEVSDRPVVAGPHDREIARRLHAVLDRPRAVVALADLLPGPWDAVCVIQPFELSAETIDEALRGGQMAPRRVAVAAAERHVPEPNWLLVTLAGDRLVEIVHFHHREIDIASGPVCAGRARARLAAITVEPGHPLRVALQR